MSVLQHSLGTLTAVKVLCLGRMLKLAIEMKNDFSRKF